MAIALKFPRGSRAAFNAMASAASLIPFRAYWISDEGRLAVATSANSSVDIAKLAEISAAPQWAAPIRAAGTGAAQNITVPAGMSVEQLFVYVNGLMSDTTEYSISGTLLTITAPSGAAIVIRYLGASITPTRLINYIAEGDSITLGLGVGDAAGSYPALGVQNATHPPTFYPLGTGGNWWSHSSGTTLPGDVATSGITIATIVANYATRGVASGYDGSKDLNVVSCDGGTNDGPGHDIPTCLGIYRNLRKFFRAARATGYQRTIVATLISRGDPAASPSGSTFDANLTPINAYIQAEWNRDLDCDALMDFATISQFSTRSNYAASGCAYESPPIHPNASGYALMQPVATAAINAAVSTSPIGRQVGAYWSPYDCSSYFTLSNSNRTVAWTSSGFADATIRSLVGKVTGKWYWEINIDTAGNIQLGIVSQAFESYNFSNARSLLNQPNAIGAGWNGNNGDIRHATTDGTYPTTSLTTQPALTAGRYRFAMDMDAKLYWYSAVGSNWNGSSTADPSTGAGGVDISGLLPSITGAANPFYPAAEIRSNGGVITSCFKASEQSGTIPLGYSAIGGA